jgi:NAD(P)-dependent dehydrogenase (short-subunit alcohol dehydrogenase family)
MIRAALVTGGAQRIGRVLCLALARRGAAVAIHCNRSVAAGESLAEEIRGQGGRAVVLGADLSDASRLAALVGEASEALGPLDLLVNNASLFEPDRFGDLDPALWQAQFDVNLRAPVFLSEAFARQAPKGQSSIVNVLDQKVLRLNPLFFSYTLTKSALLAATQTMAQALAPDIRVNAVGPGPTLPNRHEGPDGLERERRGIPLQRLVDPAEIADAVLYLAEAKTVTGQMIAVDSGQHLGWRTPDLEA